MIGFTCNEIQNCNDPSNPKSYRSYPACLVLSSVMFALALVLGLAAGESVPSDDVCEALLNAKVEYVKSYIDNPVQP